MNGLLNAGPLEAKIKVIQETLNRGHGTIATTIADTAMASHRNAAVHVTLSKHIC